VNIHPLGEEKFMTAVATTTPNAEVISPSDLPSRINEDLPRNALPRLASYK
jgi:hypothetical protein